MIAPQDAQVKKDGFPTKDSVYKKWLLEDVGDGTPYINNNPDYHGGISKYKPHMMVFGSGTPKK